MAGGGAWERGWRLEEGLFRPNPAETEDRSLDRRGQWGDFLAGPLGALCSFKCQGAAPHASHILYILLLEKVRSLQGNGQQ